MLQIRSTSSVLSQLKGRGGSYETSTLPLRTSDRDVNGGLADVGCWLQVTEANTPQAKPVTEHSPSRKPISTSSGRMPKSRFALKSRRNGRMPRNKRSKHSIRTLTRQSIRLRMR